MLSTPLNDLITQEDHPLSNLKEEHTYSLGLDVSRKPPLCSSLRPQPSFPIQLCLTTLPMHTPLVPSYCIPRPPPPPFGSSHTKVSCLPRIVWAWMAVGAGSVHPSPLSAPLCHSSGLIQSLIRKEEEKDKATVGSAPSGLPLFTTWNSCFTKENLFPPRTICHFISRLHGLKYYRFHNAVW